jgi:hypothetical protein
MLPPPRYPTVLLLATLVLLAGMTVETLARPRAADAAPFHARMRAAAARLPLNWGPWTGEDAPIVEAAVKLLHPNVMIERRYVNPAEQLAASLLIVQCSDARDMQGHYPPNCYPGQGFRLEETTDLGMDLAPQGSALGAGRRLTGRRYLFSRTADLTTVSITVDNYLLVPGRGCVREMREVYAVGSDYARRHYGAAQIQIVMQNALVRPADRDRVARELLELARPVLEVLLEGSR